MKLNKDFIVIVAIIICGAVAVAVALRRQSARPDFSLTSYDRITVLGGSDFTHALEMDRVLSGLRKGKQSVTTKPDQVLLLHSRVSKKPRFLSFFLTEGFIFDGYYIDAWTESMEERKSSVYLLDSEQKTHLNALLKVP